MPSEKNSRSRLRASAIRVAYRTETGIRDRLAKRAARRGWTPAVLPYSGYAGGTNARVLGRVVLAPPSVDPSARRGIAAWKRLLTLESPNTTVSIELGGTTTTAVSDEAGIIDARVSLAEPLDSKTAQARLSTPGRPAVSAAVHTISTKPVRGVICDVDDTVWITGISHPARAAWRTLSGTSGSRKAVPGMARLLGAVVQGQHDPGVIYLSNGPWNLVGPVLRFLRKSGYPRGAILMTDWGITPTRFFRDGKKHKSSSIARLMDDLPHVEWVLVGDDGEHDPGIYEEAVRTHPDRVLAIALRQVGSATTKATTSSVLGVPVLRGSNGEQLLPLLRDVLGGSARTGA